jgi:hypothetical protein
VAAATKKAFTLRYQLLTYIYGGLYLAHSKGGTLARAVLFTDPTDLGARNATKQWLLGDAVLVSPVITPHTNTLSAYFTAGAWYSAWDYSRMDVPQGAPVKLRVPVGDIAVHYRGGSIVPMQQYAAVTKDVRLSPITLVVALPSQPSNGRVSTMSPVPPYALEQTCAVAHARNADQLVSCGFLYMDGGEDITVSTDNSVQVRPPSYLSRLFSLPTLEQCSLLPRGIQCSVSSFVTDRHAHAAQRIAHTSHRVRTAAEVYRHSHSTAQLPGLQQCWHSISSQQALLVSYLHSRVYCSNSSTPTGPAQLHAAHKPCFVAGVQVWYTASASPTGDSGTITNVVRSDAGAAQGKLVIEAIHILGVPKASSPVLEGNNLPSVTINGKTLDSGYDASSGVIKLTGLSVPVGEPLQLRWKL